MTIKCISSAIYDPLEYVGESTDTKPSLTEVNAGSTFLELNTGNMYMWDGISWRLM